MSGRPRALIIGFGNMLRSDDGVGPYVARALATQGYDAIEAPQLLPEMAERIARFARVIFVEIDARAAALADLAPGEIVVARVAGEPAAFSSTHFASTPGSLLDLVKQLYGAEPEAILVGIGPASLEIGEQLSPAVESAAEKAIEEIVKLAERPPG